MDSNKPILYVPDYVEYAFPFDNIFNVIEGEKEYDLDIAKTADVVMLTGGADINPIYYAEMKHPSTHFYRQRDQKEKALIDQCLERGQGILGICRGAEWISIVGGGKLFQDVSGHQTGHAVQWGNLKTSIHTSSLHHQMCDLRNVPDAKVLAWARGISGHYDGNSLNPENNSIKGYSLKEPEVFMIPRIRAFAIQGHPEMLTNDATFNVLSRFAVCKFFGQEPTQFDTDRVNLLLDAERLFNNEANSIEDVLATITPERNNDQ